MVFGIPDTTGRQRCLRILLLLFLIQIPFFLYNYGKLSSFNLRMVTYYLPQHKPLTSYYHLPSKNISWIDENPLFSKYKVETVNTPRKRVTVVIIVSTAPKRFDRRQAIRDTFWKECVKTKDVTPECIFITDKLEPNQPYYNETQDELQKYDDLKLQNLQGGVQFGERMVYHFLYALKNYEFDYFIRMDDDYFVCMNRLLQELPTPMQPYLHWGWCHPYSGIMRPEESLILFSIDIIDSFLHQNRNTMKCHPLADQMIAQWALELNFKDFFRHDPRLHHTPIVSKKPELLKDENVCKNYIGIHGSYPQYMRTLYNHRGPIFKSDKNILDYSTVMKSDVYGNFNWRGFGDKWRYEPKNCISNPTWDTPQLGVSNGAYGGRQETKD